MNFKCYYKDCKRSYQSRQNLRRHVNTDHLKIKTYPCSICSRLLSSKRNLANHTNKHLKLVLVDEVKLNPQKALQSSVDIKPILLSRYFKEKQEIYHYQSCSMNLLKLLPPVSSNRQLMFNSKIKLAPGLLDCKSSNDNHK